MNWLKHKTNAEEVLKLVKDMMEKAVILEIPLIADAAIEVLDDSDSLSLF